MAKLTPRQRRFVLYGIVILALIMTGLYIDGVFRQSKNVERDTADLSRDVGYDKEWTENDEGRNEKDVPVSALDSHTAPADQPRALYIPKLSIAARVFPMGTHKDGLIQAPIGVFDAGWYKGSAKPGENGATFIDGHASGATREGLFAYLDTLTHGDVVEVERGDGSRLQYKVVHVEKVPLDKVDMGKALKPYEGVEKGLNLMTCTGVWLRKSATYDHRVVVYTELVQQ